MGSNTVAAIEITSLKMIAKQTLRILVNLSISFVKNVFKIMYGRDEIHNEPRNNNRVEVSKRPLRSRSGRPVEVFENK